MTREEREERNERIYQMRLSGMKYSEIGKIMGIHLAYARDIFISVSERKSYQEKYPEFVGLPRIISGRFVHYGITNKKDLIDKLSSEEGLKMYSFGPKKIKTLSDFLGMKIECDKKGVVRIK